MLLMTVADTGVGMSREHLKHLFDIQYKASRPGTCDEQGTGLGLILCKEFIERHDGQLTIESQEGQGTTCRFTLPQGKPPPMKG
jgi:signal transduction histidine kinase